MRYDRTIKDNTFIMNTIFSSIRIPSMHAVGKRLRGNDKTTKKVAPMPQKEATPEPEHWSSVSISDNDDSESVNSIDVPIHIKHYRGPVCFETHSVTSIHSEDCKTRRVSFHLDTEVHHYQNSAGDVEHSKLYYSPRDNKQFQQEAQLEEMKRRSEEKLKCSNERVINEDTEDLIRCIASQFCLKIQ